MEFRVETEVRGGVPVLRVQGDLDLATVDRLDEAIDEALAAGPTALVVDLARVDHLASVALSSLLRARSLVHELTIARCSTRSRRTFEVAGLERFFVFDDADAGPQV